MLQRGTAGAIDPAQGVFETTLVVDGRAVEVDAHLARLEASVRELYGLPLPANVRALIEEGAAGLALGRLRLTVVPGQEPTVRTAEVEAGLVFPKEGTEVALVTVAGGIGAHKWADRRLLDRASEEVAPAVALVVDEDGSVLEGSRSNLFAVVGGAIVTPSTDGRILPGVARARAIELARATGIEVVERGLSIDELAGADEVFLTGGVRGVEPVGRCAGVGEWDSGEITARVAAELQRAWLAADTSS
jgi:branched-subunit amino acid aminotransferase/4-amino-4-deoxychorismate lyase